MYLVLRLLFISGLALPCWVHAGNMLPSREHIDGWLQGLGSDNKFDPDMVGLLILPMSVIQLI